MRSIISVTAAAAVLGLTVPAIALEGAAALRCDAAIAKGESRLFGCLAGCRDKAEKRGPAFSAADEARCTDRCERPLARIADGPRCAGAAMERVSIESVAGLDATTLRCRSTASGLASRLSSCLADCSELAEHAALRGIAYDGALCVAACEANDATALALAEARTGCQLGAVE
ncbi:MAG: hypothetical protein IT293_01860 [Deltaproteobacteria bacterium]|nr:hypothetical protein [Deltaproteobacteria bacterium]